MCMENPIFDIWMEPRRQDAEAEKMEARKNF